MKGTAFVYGKKELWFLLATTWPEMQLNRTSGVNIVAFSYAASFLRMR
jgi:hypothetical protein